MIRESCSRGVVSHHVSSWAWRQPITNPRQKLVLVKLADSANDDGVCWPSLRTLARDTGMSKSAVERNAVELEKLGLLRIEKRTRPDGGHTSNLYHLGPGQGVPPEEDGVSRSGGTGCPAQGGTEPEENRKSTSPTTSSGRGPQSVDGKKVTAAEHDLTDGILAVLNEAMGKKFAGKEWRRAIIMRIREHPELTLAEHKGVIEFQVANPWWRGDPTPSVIYGRGDVFDRAMNSVRGSGHNDGDDTERRYTTD